MSAFGPVSRDPRVRYYVAQYGYVWSLTLGELRRFLRLGAEGHPYNLDECGHRLAGLHTFARGQEPPKRWIGRYLIRPLDWETEEFAYALRDLEEALDEEGRR